jgi:hypothetical protein
VDKHDRSWTGTEDNALSIAGSKLGNKQKCWSPARNEGACHAQKIIAGQLMNKMVRIVGAVFGIPAFPMGLFAGLQVSPLLGDILLLPLVVASWLTDMPLSHMSGWTVAILASVSSLFWAVVFGALSLVVRRLKS